jgi:hypothetical protein
MASSCVTEESTLLFVACRPRVLPKPHEHLARPSASGMALQTRTNRFAAIAFCSSYDNHGSFATSGGRVAAPRISSENDRAVSLRFDRLGRGATPRRLLGCTTHLGVALAQPMRSTGNLKDTFLTSTPRCGQWVTCGSYAVKPPSTSLQS